MASDGLWKTAPHLELLNKAVIRTIRRSGRLCISLPPRHGKALALDTPIPTPNGWTTMGQLEVGDKVFDENGVPCNVTWASPVWEHRPVYAITTDDGDVIVADEEHEWLVRLCRKRPVFHLKTTKQLADRTCNRKPTIKAQGALQLPEKDLVVDPYTLGCWLGDGRTDNSDFTSADQEIIDELQRIEGGGVRYRGIKEQGKAVAFSVGVCFRDKSIAPKGRKSKTLQARLRKLGVIGNKHIPSEYLRSSISQRKRLLQGLVDTDGGVASDGQVEVTTMLPRLASQIKELVSSLGHKASIIEGRAMLYGKDCGTKYRVMFYMEGAALLSRKAVKCRHGLRAFRRYIDVKFLGYANTKCIEVDSPNHMFLCGKSMLPTHNSELCSRYLPSWYFSSFPDRKIIWAGYSQAFANDFGRMCRDLIEEYGPNYFGVRISKDSRSTKFFCLEGESGYMAAVGMGGPLTGRGAHLLVIDDPIKNEEEAGSETIREKHWRWWQSTASTRIEPGGAVIVIQTRWHLDDLTGRIIENDTDGRWEVLSLPAIAAENDPIGRKPGEALWPERYPLEVLEEIRKTVGSYYWSALYQQTPIPDGAGLFMPEWFLYADRVPLYRPAKAVRYWDKASTQGGGDYSAGVLMVECDGHFYVADVKRGQWSSMNRERIIRETAEADDARWGGIVRTIVEQEGGSSGVDSAQATIRGLAGYVAGSERVTGDKVTRARPYSSQVEGGNVSLLPGPWHRDYLNELRAFPNGKHDDQVDASSGAFKEVSKGVFPNGIVQHVISSAEKKAYNEGVKLHRTKGLELDLKRQRQP